MDDKLNGIMQRIERKTYLVNPPIHKIEINPSDFNWMIQIIEQQQEAIDNWVESSETEQIVKADLRKQIQEKDKVIERLKEEINKLLVGEMESRKFLNENMQDKFKRQQEEIERLKEQVKILESAYDDLNNSRG